MRATNQPTTRVNHNGFRFEVLDSGKVEVYASPNETGPCVIAADLDEAKRYIDSGGRSATITSRKAAARKAASLEAQADQRRRYDEALSSARLQLTGVARA